MGDFFKYSLPVGDSKLTIGSLLLFCLALLASYIFAKVIVRLLYNFLVRRNIESGRVFSITRILKYTLYFLFFIISLQLLDLNLHGLILGASALLIGVGIGLQQIFYDLFSGLLMLIERKVQVGDFVEIDGMVGRVDAIEMRTSVVRTLDNISVIVPNSKLISENVTNWSSNRGLARFFVSVGVAYGSNVELVRQTLIDCAVRHDKVLDKPAPRVFFSKFGDSSLDFKIFFWSVHFREIEIIKSDLHFMIDKAFKEKNIVIAFPQMDVHIKRS